ncbi:MAG: hypothetical protein IKD73_00650 [Selenomonadaceae bacterium]|nr:hypothetical protein [Selenomonadaceae bacterium]
MKTVPELIRDADSLNKFMASTHETQNHLLATIDDEYAQDVYLTLLMSVAETTGQFDETRNNPLAYVCKIAAELPVTPDMQEIFRRSLLIDEKILNDYSVTLKQHNLQNLLLFDALTMQILYAKDAAQMSEYIAGLANVFGTGTDGLSEILLIVKTVINREKNFSHKFQHVNCFEFLPYLRRSCKNLFVEAADTFFMDFETECDVTNDFQHPLTLNNKKIVHFRNIYLHDKKFSFNINETTTAEFENCRFENLTDDSVREFEINGNEYSFPFEIRRLNFRQIDTVKITSCKFVGMISNLIDYRSGAQFFLSEYIPCGILIALIDVNQFIVCDCEFKDCFYREMAVGGNYGLFRDSSSGEYMTLQEKFRPNNFTVADFVKHATVNLRRDALVGSMRLKNMDTHNINVINSFRF